jgi:hypothetical protein
MHIDEVNYTEKDAEKQEKKDRTTYFLEVFPIRETT